MRTAIVTLILVFSSCTAFAADAPSPLDNDQLKSVYDAAFDQQRDNGNPVAGVARLPSSTDQSLRYLVQYADPSGSCVQEIATVTAVGSGQAVEFSGAGPIACLVTPAL